MLSIVKSYRTLTESPPRVVRKKALVSSYVFREFTPLDRNRLDKPSGMRPVYILGNVQLTAKNICTDNVKPSKNDFLIVADF